MISYLKGNLNTITIIDSLLQLDLKEITAQTVGPALPDCTNMRGHQLNMLWQMAAH